MQNLIRPYEGKPKVNSPLIHLNTALFLEGGGIGGVPLGSHDHPKKTARFTGIVYLRMWTEPPWFEKKRCEGVQR